MTQLVKAVMAKLPNQTEFSTQEQIGNVIAAIEETVKERVAAGEAIRFGKLGTFKARVREAGTIHVDKSKDAIAYPAYTGIKFDDSDSARAEVTALKAAKTAPETQEDGA